MSRIRRNFLSMTLSQGATMMLALLSVSIIPKYLGASSFGALTFATTFVGLFASVSLLGTGAFLVKTIARDPTRVGPYVFNALAMKLALSSLLAAIALGVAHVVGYPPQTFLIVAIGCLGMIIAALNDVFTAALQGLERMGRLALWTGIQQYAAGAVAIVLVLAGKGAAVYAFVITVGGMIPLVANGIHLWPEIWGHRKVDLGLWRTIAAGGIPFFLWGLLLFVYGSIDILMLESMTSSDVVGWYNLAYRWVGIPVVLPFLLATVVLPALSSLAIANEAEFRRLVNRAIQIALFAAIPMATGVAFVAGDIIRLFHYPAGYEHSVVLMQILAFHIPVVALDMVLVMALTATDRQKAWLIVGVIAVVVNPSLNLIAIPMTSRAFGNGAIGASIVTVLTELVVMAGAIYLRPTGVLDRATTSFSVRCAIAAALMVPALVAAAGLPLAVKVAIGAAVFATGAWALRLFSLRTAYDGAIRSIQSFAARRHGISVPGAAEQ
jgi:O-antigen/teichoic acid export membrane protein